MNIIGTLPPNNESDYWDENSMSCRSANYKTLLEQLPCILQMKRYSSDRIKSFLGKMDYSPVVASELAQELQGHVKSAHERGIFNASPSGLYVVKNDPSVADGRQWYFDRDGKDILRKLHYSEQIIHELGDWFLFNKRCAFNTGFSRASYAVRQYLDAQRH